MVLVFIAGALSDFFSQNLYFSDKPLSFMLKIH